MFDPFKTKKRTIQRSYEMRNSLTLIVFLFVFILISTAAYPGDFISKHRFKDVDGYWKRIRMNDDTIRRYYKLRNTKWGMKKSQVKKIEKTESCNNPIELEDQGNITILSYDAALFEKDCIVSYIFFNDKLIKLRYTFIMPYPTESYVVDFHKVGVVLSELFGDPLDYGMGWKNNESWGDMEVPTESGLYDPNAKEYHIGEWKDSKTYVVSMLDFDDNGNRRFRIEYRSEELKELFEN